MSQNVSTYKRLQNIAVESLTDDTDIASEFFYSGALAGVEVATIEVKNTDDILLVDPVNTLITIPLDSGGTGAGSAKTMGDLETAFDAGTYPGWHMIRRAPRATLLYATDTKLLFQAATNAAQLLAPGGAKVYWDTSSIVARRLCIGNQTNLVNVNNKVRPFFAKRFWDTVDIHRDPIENNLGGSGRAMNYPYNARIESVHARSTAVGGFTVTVQSCYKDRDGSAVAEYDSWTAATTALLELDDELGEWITQRGGFIFIELLGAAAISVVDFGAKGSLGALS